MEVRVVLGVILEGWIVPGSVGGDDSRSKVTERANSMILLWFVSTTLPVFLRGISEVPREVKRIGSAF